MLCLDSSKCLVAQVSGEVDELSVTGGVEVVLAEGGLGPWSR